MTTAIPNPANLPPVGPMAQPSPDLKEIARLAREAAGLSFATITPPAGSIGLPSAIPVAVKHGQQPELVSLASEAERWRLFPKRRTGTAKVLTLESFTRLVEYHRTPTTVVFADTNWKTPSLTAVLDYHPNHGEAPQNGTHRVHYAFPLSEEWKAWSGINGQKLDQGQFAAFIEDHIAELATPTADEVAQAETTFGMKVATPAEMMQLSRGLTVNVESRVKQIKTLQTGEGVLEWNEQHTDADGKPLRVPGMFILSLAPFFNGSTARIPARLRYRAAGGSVTWYVQLFRPDVHVTNRIVADLYEFHEQTGITLFEGSPEMAGHKPAE